ncbi:lipid-A-disaccharide synthase [Alphaproteobacteria bacterium GH1-50]|uniref:Lipid-A-disaccharide synthase n=1 Tax=Kangsaoukella pontilimi TaxID=2691042 RepID=A0A7C9IF98_9RHOB|nr:lipid-A-disaccharide synthase [Kangsaoukella pontilimi]MXQ07207.1 lipid-A-disaccharide synthase [Kangsaoukella pontilimi]
MKLYLLAGEPSGDKLGGALMAGLKALLPDVEFAGVGGPLMEAEGLSSLFPMDELSVMGIAEVLPKYPELKRRLNQTADDVIAKAPDALITIDSPDFSLRLARLVKERSDIRTVHYVAPSVWAWRAGRAAKMAKSIDHVLALLPFEPPYMEAEGMRCDFVGHPIVAEPVASMAEADAFRKGKGIGDAPMLVVLPGSRRAEVGRLAPIFGEALRVVLGQVPKARVVVPAARPVASAVIEAVATWPGAPIVLDPRGDPQADRMKRAAFRAADAALAASGTVSLELAASETPMVVAYDMNWLSWQIMSRMAKVDTVTLVNLVTGRKAIPEFLGPACQPKPVGEALATLMTDDRQRAFQHAAMSETMTALGRGGEAPGLRAARAVLDGLGR